MFNFRLRSFIFFLFQYQTKFYRLIALNKLIKQLQTIPCFALNWFFTKKIIVRDCHLAFHVLDFCFLFGIFISMSFQKYCFPSLALSCQSHLRQHSQLNLTPEKGIEWKKRVCSHKNKRTCIENSNSLLLNCFALHHILYTDAKAWNWTPIFN